MRTQATIRGTQAQISEMFGYASVGYHEEIYVNIEDGRLRILAGAPDSSSGAYVDLVEAFFNGVDGGTEAYLEVGQIQSYMSLVSSGPSTELDLEFKGGDGMAQQLRITPTDREGDEVTLMLMSGDKVLESVPTGLPKRFDQNNNFLHPTEDRPAKVHIDTYVSELQRIVDAVGLREDLNYYPIVVDGEDFILEVGDEKDQYVSATLQGKVDNEDGHKVDNLYGGSFSNVVGSLEGSIIVQTEDGSPVHLLQEKNHVTVRHMIGTARAV